MLPLLLLAGGLEGLELVLKQQDLHTLVLNLVSKQGRLSLILLGQGRNLSCCFYSDGVEVLIEGYFITRLKAVSYTHLTLPTNREV